MKQIAITFLLLLSSTLILSQSRDDKGKAVFLELAGSGGLGSINYEREFSKKNSNTFTWRAGLSFTPVDKNNGTVIVFPVMVNALFGNSAHKLELGLGQGVSITTKGKFFIRGIAGLGYRYQSESSRWFYRLTYTPLLSYLIDFQFQHWGGLSIGYLLNTRSK